MTDKPIEVHETGNASDAVTVKATRGEQSWNYILIALGFALSITGTVVQLTPLHWPWGMAAYIVLGGGELWLFLYNGAFQNGLLKWKARHESRPR